MSIVSLAFASGPVAFATCAASADVNKSFWRMKFFHGMTHPKIKRALLVHVGLEANQV